MVNEPSSPLTVRPPSRVSIPAKPIGPMAEKSMDVRTFAPDAGVPSSTTIGFGTLALSSYAPLGKLGIVSATSVVFVAFASLLVLPVVLGARTR